jgi:hypothetical protein
LPAVKVAERAVADGTVTVTEPALVAVPDAIATVGELIVLVTVVKAAAVNVTTPDELVPAAQFELKAPE